MAKPKIPSLAQKRAELSRKVAEASARAYVNGIKDVGGRPGEVGIEQAFIDGFMTAIESLLAKGSQR